MKSIQRALIKYDCCPYKKTLGQRHAEGRPCEDTGRGEKFQAKKKGLPMKQACRHLDLGSSLQQYEEILFKLPTLWYLLMVGLSN